MAKRGDDANPYAAPESDLEPESYSRGSRTSFEYANFGIRFVAAFVDGIIVNIIGFVAGLGVGVVAAAINSPDFATFGGGAVGLLIGWLYSALQESSDAQATLGKKMMGIKVVDMEGQKISFGKATGRHFGKIISGIICLVGYLMQPFNEKKQALHDMLAGCLVVKS